MSKILTNEGSIQYEHSNDLAVEFFSKSGSLYENKTKKSFYNNENTALSLFKPLWFSGQKEISLKLLFWLRDVRNGSGNRSGSRTILKWLAETDPKWVIANIEQIPEIGRWDDLRALNGTDAEQVAVEIWANAIAKKDGLACKWADRSDTNIFRELRKTKIVKDIGDFRRLLSDGRKNIVERKMCENAWNQIEYPHVPSVAMSRYTKAFNKHDEIGFAKFKEKVEKGEAKINASAIFPHDLCRALHGGGDTGAIDAQFNAMPNWVGDTNLRIMTICDSSGSMGSFAGGSIQNIDISTSLSLYCSDRIPKDSPFHRKFIQFESESNLTDWSGKTFSEAYGYGKNPVKSASCYGSQGIFNGACGGTRIDIALDMLLNHAKMFGATNEQIPNLLLIISDMQFSSCSGYYGDKSENQTVIENCLEKWEKAGYRRPKIVYWNVDGYAGSPATVNHKDVGLVSGFSPSILEAVLGAEDFTPLGIMLKKLEKYQINIPK